MRILFPIVMLILLIAFSTPAAAQEWIFQVVDDAGDMGYQSRIAVTSDGSPHILYLSSGGAVMLASWVPTGPGEGGWERLLLDSGASPANAIDMLVDANDKLHITYGSYFYGRINYIVYDPVAKTYIVPRETVVSEAGDVDLALFESGGKIYPAIAYIAYNKLKLATRDPDSHLWSIQTIYDDHNAYYAPSIACDSAGGLHISFYENDGANLMYATNANESHTWISEYVDLPGNVGRYSAIVLDSGDVPYIVYYDATNTDLKYAKLVTP